MPKQCASSNPPADRTLKYAEIPTVAGNKGREKEANAIVQKIFGDQAVMSREPKAKVKTTFLDIFRNGNGKWTVFVAVFWSLQVISTFAIGTYIPEILGQFGFANGTREYLGSAVINMFYLAGLLPFLYLVERYGRRPTLIWPFFVCAVSLVLLGATSGLNMSFVFILVFFIIYGVFNTGMGMHEWIYPNELFPTHIRGTAMSFATGVSRIDSSLGTFIFPAFLANYGLASTFYACGALYFLGFLVAVFMAPAIKNMSLAQASSINKGSTLQDDNLILEKQIK